MSYGSFRRVNQSVAHAAGKLAARSAAEMLLIAVVNAVLSIALAIMVVANTATGIVLVATIMVGVNTRFTFRFIRDVKFITSTSRLINREVEIFVEE